MRRSFVLIPVAVTADIGWIIAPTVALALGHGR
jgi:hypothetical protein